MTQRDDPHAADAMVGPHGQPSDHGADASGDHGHDDHGHDDHGHTSEAEALGPINLRAWGAGILGIALGLVVVGAFLVSNGHRLGGL
ncbi:MAG: hypothetical protein FIA92_04650 [Chloroflexi bacterium]|nr:hypothetical protein [Chloroflexota bacterium]